MLQGNRVYLAPLDKANMATALVWLTDPEVNRFMLSGHEPMTLEDEERWYDEMATSETDEVFEIHVAEDGRYIGNTGLNKIDRTHRSAELGIMVGSKPDQNQGYGRDAMVTLLRHAFEDLGLHRVFLRCDPLNERGVRAYEGVGFTRVGHEREAVLIEGRWCDHLVFDMLEDEFRARYDDAPRAIESGSPAIDGAAGPAGRT
jgi:RimJ/RimL family protein N-acetyltransferase